MPAPVVALLGPTNTGKTYLAMERMLTHASGMIGFPLRLLARENYERVVRLRGAHSVALVTGEERVIPPAPSYFVCTVEAMPLDRQVDFLAVDEVQLAADRERGHVFTDRLLRARGRHETMLLGAETIRPLLRLLVPGAQFLSRPRLSTLRYRDPVKVHRLPRRSAVVAFSLADVYAVAERLRREVGGAALVFGALSPRTRNAQVGLFQAGEVDYLVATDAIGMGLNLDIEHVAFTGLVKFDGLGPRPLRPAEVAQVAGRAGRHVQDGTFGPTAELGPFPRELIDAVENHRFEPLASIFWRNAELDFATPRALLASLERRPPLRQLVRMRQADDHRALAVLAADPELQRLAPDEDGVRLLWEVCQVPDFRNVMSEAHARLLGQLFRHLASPAGRLPEEWVTGLVQSLDRIDGDIDALLTRIAGIRTWTYVSHRAGWLLDAVHWQERTRAVEDRLSDALHDRLTREFVDRRAAVLARFAPGDLLTAVGADGEMLVQGLSAGRLHGFRFVPEPGLDGSRGLLAAANRALRENAPERVRTLSEAPDTAFSLTAGGEIAWCDAPVARLAAGDDVLAPRVEVLPSELLDATLRERVRRRLASWLEAHVRAGLGPLYLLRETSPPGPARGLAFAMVEGLGSAPRRQVATQVRALSPADRRALAKLGVVIGRTAVYLPALLGRESLRLRRLLCRTVEPRLASSGSQSQADRALSNGHALADLDGRPSARLEAALPESLYWACGYAPARARAVRVDRLERLAAIAHRMVRQGPFAASARLAAITGSSPQELGAILGSLGFVEERGLYRRRR